LQRAPALDDFIIQSFGVKSDQYIALARLLPFPKVHRDNASTHAGAEHFATSTIDHPP
jgi:hypothetical protein